MEDIILIATISILVIISPYLSNISRIPVAVIEILLGMITANFGVLKSNETFEVIANVGFLFLMFLAGMEADLTRFVSIPRILLKRAALYFLVLYSGAFLIYLYFDLPEVYLVALPVVSIGMIMALIKEFGRKEQWLKLALIMGVFGELISITALVILDGNLQYGLGEQFYGVMATLVVFLIVTVVGFKAARILFWWYPEIKTRIMPHEDLKNQDIRFSFAIFFIMLSMMLYLELKLVLGAFLAGMVIVSFFEHKKELPEKLSAFGFGFLVPVFFIYIGSTLNLEIMLSVNLIERALFIVACMMGLHMLSAFSVFYSHLGFKNTVLLALSDSMPLTFLVATATIGYQANAITTLDYYAFIGAALLEAILIMTLIQAIRYFSAQQHKQETPVPNFKTNGETV